MRRLAHQASHATQRSLAVGLAGFSGGLDGCMDRWFSIPSRWTVHLQNVQAGHPAGHPHRESVVHPTRGTTTQPAVHPRCPSSSCGSGRFRGGVPRGAGGTGPRAFRCAVHARADTAASDAGKALRCVALAGVLRDRAATQFAIRLDVLMEPGGCCRKTSEGVWNNLANTRPQRGVHCSPRRPSRECCLGQWIQRSHLVRTSEPRAPAQADGIAAFWGVTAKRSH